MNVVSPSVPCSPRPTAWTYQTPVTAHCVYSPGCPASETSPTCLRIAANIQKAQRHEPTLENSHITGKDQETSKWSTMY